MSKERGGDEAVATPRPGARPSELEPTIPLPADAGATPPPAPAAGVDEPTPTLNVPPGSSGKSKIPTQIGRYQVLERVGKGGMGVLYRGIDPVLDREVAIKLMLGDFSDDHDQLRPRFYREARAVAKLQHRNIVTVFEFAEDGTTPYIVMEFLRGTSLASRMESGPPLTLDDKLDIVAQLCAGLGYAHDQGIVHRDVKPANVFLLGDGTVKLLDFGIAKLTTSNLTRQGDVLGSPSYMSPEQIDGRENIDGRADVFSAGVLLYELLAGRKPFEAASTTGIVLKILNEDPPPLETINASIPPRLAATVKKALEKNAANRYQTAADFGRDLQVVRRSLTATEMRTISMTGPIGADTLAGNPSVVEAPPLPPPPAKNWMVPAAIGAAVVVVGIAAALMMNRPSPPAGTPATPPAAASAPSAAAPTASASQPTANQATNSTPPSPTRVAPPPGPPPKDPPAPRAQAGAALQVVSEPAGASISLDGRDTRLVTPAQIAVSGPGAHRLRLSKRGYQPIDARLSASDIQQGSLSYTLTAVETPASPPPPAAAAASMAVTASGAYAFAIYDGGRMISSASTSHQLNVAAGKKLRLVASDYFLNQTVSVDANDDKRVEFQAPALSKVSIRSSQETCNIKIGSRDLGTPPINNLMIAGGSYQVEMVCPNGVSKTQVINITPGAQTARVILP